MYFIFSIVSNLLFLIHFIFSNASFQQLQLLKLHQMCKKLNKYKLHAIPVLISRSVYINVAPRGRFSTKQSRNCAQQLLPKQKLCLQLTPSIAYID